VLTGNRAVAHSHWPAAPAPRPLETSVSGVFAVGDARLDAVKRVASAVGEGSVVIAQVHEHLQGGEPEAPAPRGERRPEPLTAPPPTNR